MPVAFLGRTSTLLLQDPAASLRRQAREVQAKLPPGWFIGAWFWDIESGGLDLEQRGHGTAHQAVNVGLPRDGGLAALLAEAAGPAPRFAAVMCEDIERSGRDTFNALKLERQLGDAGIPLFATDEPINVEGMNATTILIRRVKQGIAEWYRFQLKEKAWRGFEQHTIDGYNIGGAPYGYTPDRIPHPNPAKAAQGRTKTRLILDPPRAPVVAQIFTWRTVDKLGVTTITNRLNADPAAYPSPKPGGWTAGRVYAILRNPKYTGHMVYGRRRSTGTPPLPRRAPRPVDLVPRASPPGDHHPASLGHRPGHRRRARQRPRRRRAQPPTRRPPVLPAAVPLPLPGLQAPHERPPGPPLRRATPGTSTTPARTTRPTPATTPPSPTTPAPSGSAKTTCSPSSASSSPPACSAPTAPPCSPNASPPPPPRTPPAASRRPPGCTSGCGRSTPPRTPTPAKSRTSPACPRTHPRSPRSGPGSSHGSANWKPNATQINDRLTALDRATGQQRRARPAGRPADARRRPARPARQPSRPACSPPSAWN